MAQYTNKSEPLDFVMPKRKDGVDPRQSSDPNFNWLYAERGKAHVGIPSTIRRIIDDQRGRLWDNTKFMSMYANFDMFNANAGGAQGKSKPMPRQTSNKAKVYGDTLAGKLVQSNSKITALTNGGSWKAFRQARKIDAALEAEFRRGGLYKEASKVAIDAINTGTGYLHIYRDYDANKICFERWFPNEVFVDSLDGLYGQASMMFRMRFVKRENALALWGDTPETREIIERAPAPSAPPFAWTMYQHGMIELFEAWALPTGNRKGRHVLCFQSGCIVDEEWKHEHFPVAVFRASEAPLGWYGQGLLEQAASAQIMMNFILEIMGQSAKLGVAPFWVVAGGADVSLKQINNMPGHIVTSSGPPPQWVTNKPFHEAAPAYVQFLDNQIKSLYGINEIESGGDPGFNRVDSDPALVQLQDLWMARHTIMLKNWSEEFFLDVGKRTMMIAKDIAREKGSYPVLSKRARSTMVLDFKDFLDLAADEYTLQMAPESALPVTAAAKRKVIVELKNEGLISPERALGMLTGPPDLEAATLEITAFDDDADRIIELLMSGETPDVSSLSKLDLVIPRVRAAAVSGLNYGMPVHIEQNFTNWLADAIAAMSSSMIPAPPGPTQGAANGSFGPDGSGLAGGPAGAIPSGSGGAPGGGLPS